MRHFILSVLLSFGLIACSFGQRKVDPAFEKVFRTMTIIENLYVDTVDKNKLAEDATIALLQRLDPHSAYLTAEEAREKNEPLQGNFDGIGIQFNMLTDTLYVIQVISGGPSEKVGLMAGDRIITVNDTLIAGVKMKNNDVMSRLKGPKGTVVNIEVKRGNSAKLIPFRIVRDKIPVYSLDASYMLTPKTGYIRINRFAATTYDEFTEALQKLKKQGMENLVLDLQGNGGGYMHTAVYVANEFLKRGDLITYTEGAHTKRENYRGTNKGNLLNERLVVLVDESSASASEILAGAIQDWDRGVLVGRRTFGKGLVQRPIPLGDGSEIHLTIARYYTPSGRSVQKPYEKGDSESYNRELVTRYNHGELMHSDSIYFPDSLKYNTLVNKRVIYGGGGIMPDHFIPLDTAKYTDYHRVLVGSGTVNKYIISLIDKNRNSYTNRYKDFATFDKQFSITDNMIREVFTLYEKERKEDSTLPEFKAEDQETLLAPESLLRHQMKALVARDLWEMSEYFQVINRDNESIKEALRIIEDKAEYTRILSGKQ
ncbi:S41 family peptidase [Bacteroidales bacterium OttesenSCG-928-J19]|nr:S41 family peptidase [Bacteroidales bacterium OttesenSCG-928-J19]